MVFSLLMMCSVDAVREEDVGDTCKRLSPHWTVRGPPGLQLPPPLAEPPKANPNPPRMAETPKAFYPGAYSKKKKMKQMMFKYMLKDLKLTYN